MNCCAYKDGDERGDQRILDRSDARFVGGKLLHGFEHVPLLLQNPISAANPLLCASEGAKVGLPDFNVVNLSDIRRKLDVEVKQLVKPTTELKESIASAQAEMKNQDRETRPVG